MALSPPSIDLIFVVPQVLNLLDLQNYGHVKLIQLSHLFALEVTDLLLSVLQVSINILLFILHALLLILKIADVELDAFLLIVQVKTGVTQTFDFVDLGIVAELRVEVLIIIVVFFLLDLFFLGLLVFFTIFGLFLLDLLRSPPLLGDALVEGKNGIIVVMVGRDQLMEVFEQLSLLVFDIFDLSTLADQLL